MAVNQWRFLESPVSSPEKNMERDACLLEEMNPEDLPILHFYEWEGPCATYGHFIQPYDHLSQSAVQKHGLNLARRPTGGGVTFHLTDLAFSVLVPASNLNYSLNVMNNYAYVNKHVAAAVKSFLGVSQAPVLLEEESDCISVCHHFCMAKPTKYDVLWEGKKVGGGAQRRTKKGFLHQGTIALALPALDLLVDLLGENSPVLTAMQKQSYYLIGESATENQIIEARNSLKEHLKHVFSTGHSV